jgi:SAM-dependent methyltransferase
MRFVLAPLLCILIACAQPAGTFSVAYPGTDQTDQPFPPPDRPVASIVSSHSGTEAVRDDAGEAEKTIDLLPLTNGVVVADIGAGDGYFTTRLARQLGETGDVVATDVTPEYLEGLKQRIALEGLTNVSFVLGGYDDPRLAPESIDIALMVRMYHEIEQPYAFLWRLRSALKPGAVVAVSERDRPTVNHGIPPALLKCEFEAVGYEQVSFTELGPGIGYVAQFAASRPAPEPADIKPCAD